MRTFVLIFSLIFYSAVNASIVVQPKNISFQEHDGFGWCNGFTVYLDNAFQQRFGAVECSRELGFEIEDLSEENIFRMVTEMRRFIRNLPADSSIEIQLENWDPANPTSIFLVLD